MSTPVSGVYTASAQVIAEHQVAHRAAYHPTVPLVIFDLDNTLLDRDGAFRAWVAAFGAERGLDRPEQQ